MPEGIVDFEDDLAHEGGDFQDCFVVRELLGLR
jgi:hypothetical protein